MRLLARIGLGIAAPSDCQQASPAAAVKLGDLVLDGLEGIYHVTLRSERIVPAFKSRRYARRLSEMGVGSALRHIGLNLRKIEDQLTFGLELFLRRFVCPSFRFLECCAFLCRVVINEVELQ